MAGVGQLTAITNSLFTSVLNENSTSYYSPVNTHSIIEYRKYSKVASLHENLFNSDQLQEMYMCIVIYVRIV